MKGSSGHLRADSAPPRGITGRLISTYYIEIQYLLERVECATTHYQVFGLERTARPEEVNEAHNELLAKLKPLDRKVRASIPQETTSRVDRAVERATDAFNILTDAAKRTEYDRTLVRRVVQPLPVTVPAEVKRPEVKRQSPPAPGLPVRRTQIEESHSEQRRRSDRIRLSIPVMVVGYTGADTKWKEITHTVDVSRGGAGLLMSRRLRPGIVLLVTMPLPPKLRTHGITDPGFKTYAIVRRVEPTIDGKRVVGVEFIGENAPPGFLDAPWMPFRSQKWSGPDRRSESREEKAESVVLTFLNERLQPVSEAAAITENISKGGARVQLRTAPEEVEYIRVRWLSGNQKKLAIVRNRFSGKDGYERLCLQYMEEPPAAKGLA